MIHITLGSSTNLLMNIFHFISRWRNNLSSNCWMRYEFDYRVGTRYLALLYFKKIIDLVLFFVDLACIFSLVLIPYSFLGTTTNSYIPPLHLTSRCNDDNRSTANQSFRYHFLNWTKKDSANCFPKSIHYAAIHIVLPVFILKYSCAIDDLNAFYLHTVALH